MACSPSPTELQDSADVGDDEIVFRRVPRKQYKWVRNESGLLEPVFYPGAFGDQNPQKALEMGVPRASMSVNLCGELQRLGLEPSVVLGDRDRSEWGLARLPVGLLRKCGNGVMPWHWGTDEPGHAVVFALEPDVISNNKLKKDRMDAATWEIEPEPDPESEAESGP